MPKHPLLRRAREEGHPLIDGETVTFLWKGNPAESRKGKSPPHLVDDLHGWEDNPQPLARLARGLFACTFDLPRDAYLEYAFIDPETNERLPDPHNERRIWNGVNGYNHFFYMPGAAPTPLVRRRKEVPRGTLTKHVVPAWMLSDEGKRTVYLYRPPTDQPFPLLVVYDGNDY